MSPCKSRTSLWMSLGLAAYVVFAPITSWSQPNTASSALWFQPALTTNQDAVCAAILAGARNHTSDYEGLTAAPEYWSSEDRSTSYIQSVPDHPELLAFARKASAPLYVEQVTNPGCGGACDSESLALHTAIPVDNDKAASMTPASEGWTIVETKSGDHFVVGLVDRQLEVYRAGSNAQWKLACRVEMEPDLDHNTDPKVQEARASLHALQDAVEGMALGEGYGACGTSHANSRWAFDFQHALNQVLFYPEGTAITGTIPSENSYGDYSRIYPALQDWSLGGLFEFHALQNYDAQLKATTDAISDFYQYGFHWDAARSHEMAMSALPNAVSHRFGFYQYAPWTPETRDLRRALLTHQPMSALRSIDLSSMPPEQAGQDSILNVAIEYPEALSYLLSHKMDPNIGNAFGKTPLMYAAQYNRLVALRILLRAGANPNATTSVAPQDCSYAIDRQSVTALHYAVKFASRDVMQALLDAGAMTFIKTRSSLYLESDQGSYPLEWLHDGNPLLKEEDIKALEQRLQVPDESTRKALSVDFTAAAEAANSAGKAADAYQKIRLAVLSDPTNGRANADFPLLAIKVGAFGPAFEANARALTTAKSAADRAAALFNQGLACLDDPAQFKLYGNVIYCESGETDPFVQAWQMQPSPARTKMLLKIFSDSEPTNCVVPWVDSESLSFRFHTIPDRKAPAGVFERVYVLHPASIAIDPERIHWQNVRSQPPTLVTPHLVDTLHLNQDYSLSVLEGDAFAISASVNGATCALGNSASSQRPH